MTVRQVLVLAAAMGIVLASTIGCGSGRAKLTDPEVCAKWPFDAREAKHCQQETAKALGVPVERTIDLGDGVKLQLVLIPAGEFVMGSADSAEDVARKCGGYPADYPEAGRASATFFKGERPQHRVRITKPFYLGKYEVTQEQWRRVTGISLRQRRDKADKKLLLAGEGQRLPMYYLTWDDCHTFLKKLNARAKAQGTFALPTEAEWEYACRAGTATAFHFGETISTDDANYDGNRVYGDGRKGVYREKTTPVGSFRANAFGLHDMHGNVSEWCQDWRDEQYYHGSPRDDPKGPPKGDQHVLGEQRVLRGGAWFNAPWGCRSAMRDGAPPWVLYHLCGVRVVLRDFEVAVPQAETQAAEE